MAEKQMSSQQNWLDENGMAVPYNRTTAAERLRERHAYSLWQEAEKVSAKLTALKARFVELSQEAYDAFMAEAAVEQREAKGNYTWYNFDRSIKIEVKVHERIEFDDLGIEAARQELDDFIDATVDAKVDFVKDMVKDAFNTSRGRLDTKKVLSLLRYRTKVNDPRFDKAMDLLESAIRRPDSKTYYRIWARTANGEYESINLDFSSAPLPEVEETVEP